MEVDHRSFQSVSVTMASAQPASDRFDKGITPNFPPHAIWRCNLTALSQRYNLYFMASEESIAVYQPDFPFQKLLGVPKLLIPPTLAEPRAEGALDSYGWTPGQHPHSINHIIVGELGSEEILLLSTDSGNVAAYHTKAILDAISRDPYRFSPEGRSDLVGLRCFFSHWVRESAWGLAIHKEGRMIAVSANKTTMIADDDPNAKITVFAFALSNRVDRQVRGEEEETTLLESTFTEWHLWDPSASPEALPPRNRNYKIILAGEAGHPTNIPSISFVNTREDPDGSWLLSADIHGEMKCWQIWRGIRLASWEFAESSFYQRRRQRRSDGGWIVAALDPASFRPALSMEAFCGHDKAIQYQGYMGSGPSFDITNIVRLRTPANSRTHPLHPEHSEEEGTEAPEPAEVAAAWSSDDSDGADDTRDLPTTESANLRRPFRDGDTSTSREHPERYEALIQPESAFARSGDLMHEHESSHQAEAAQVTISSHEVQEAFHNFDALDLHDTDNDDEAGLDYEGNDTDLEDVSEFEENSSIETSNQGSPAVSDQTQRTSIEVEIGPPLLNSSPEVSSSDAARSSSASASASASPAKRTRKAQGNAIHQAPIRIPFIPTLHLSKSHLRLINLPRSRSPHLFCANLLKQDLHEDHIGRESDTLQRLNMLQQIPELGIIIIASQLGRAAICSLTKYIPTDTLGLRVDWIVPTLRQEKAGARPSMYELLGIAVAPIQGRQMPTPDPNEERDDKGRARDRVIDGVDTTFDENVVVLSRRVNEFADTSSEEEEEEEESRKQGKRRPAKRTKQSSLSSGKSSSSSAASTERRPWPAKPKQDEDWVAMEGARRYRLMMTYRDMTVLTYEISRGVDREDVAVCVAEGEEVSA